MVKNINIDVLPKTVYCGRDVIDWENSIDYLLDVIYGDIRTTIKIVGFKKEDGNVTIEWNGIKKDIYRGHLVDCKLGNIFGLYSHEYKYQIGETIEKENMNITIVGLGYLKKLHHRAYKIKCNICGFDSRNTCYKDGKEIDYYMDEYNLMSNDYCPCCNNKIVQSGVNDIATTHPWMAKYFLNKEQSLIFPYGSSKKIAVICPNCGEIKKSHSIYSIYTKHSISCRKCGDTISFPEKLMMGLLSKSSVVEEYETQYAPSWCTYKLNGVNKRGIYDNKFIIDKKKYIVETDGYFHFNDNSMNKQSQETSRMIDKEKDKLAKIHDFNVIRIDCNPSTPEHIIEEIHKSGLLNIIKLNNEEIDWNEIICQTERSIVKDVCDYFNKHNITVEKLASLFHIGNSTVWRYLLRGNKYGWCNYNPKHRYKPVIQFDLNMNEICRYESINKARKAVGGSNSEISRICNDKKGTSKGYVWRWQDEFCQ